jgi:group I intron endonuclease
MKTFSIYRITNLVNQMVYIGFTSQTPTRRWDTHRSISRNPNHPNYMHVHAAMTKYGSENFAFDVIYQSKDGVHTHKVMESLFIAEYDSFKTGYNLSAGGEGNPGRKHTDETKRRLAEMKSGTTQTTETKERISQSKKGKPNASAKTAAIKEWIVTDPNGTELCISNLNQFCKDNGLNTGAMSQVALGHREHHKGYRCRSA